MGHEKTPERPPIYDVSATKIYYFVFSSYLITSSLPHFLAIPITAGLFYGINYCLENVDIPSKVYHPDLLPQNEYLALKQKHADALKDKKRCNSSTSDLSKEDKTKLLKSYEEIIDTVQTILDAQKELRLISGFKMFFGRIVTPAIYKNEAINSNDENITPIDFESEEILSPQKSSSIINGDEVDKQCKSPLPQSTKISIANNKNESTEVTEKSKSDMQKMMIKLETLETQFAEIKAENDILKESFEKILESKTVF